MKQLSLSQPHAIVMVGVPGSGKTFFAERFAETFHAPYVNRSKLAMLAGENAADELAEYQLTELLKTGQSVIYEGTTDTRTSRLDFAKMAREAQYAVLLVWVQTDAATARNRSTKAGMTPEEYDKKAKRFTPPTLPEKPVVISGKHTYPSQAKVVLQRISAPRAGISMHASPSTRLDRQSTRRNITIR